jgi:mono/diheme cytochrome c family protein
MKRVRTSSIAVAALAVLSATAVSACGTQSIEVASTQPALKRGAQLFQERCSGCHSLAAAASNGSAANVPKGQRFNGPNFNQRKETYERALYAITNGGFSGAVMPQNIVTGADAKVVAQFVAKYSGKDVHTPVSPSQMAGGGMTKPAPAPKQDLAAVGASVFAQNGCGACHQLTAAGANGKVGPTLNGIGTDSAAMLKTSIVNPNAVVEKGYAKNVMPLNFGQLLTAEQINGLVAYLQKVAR